MRQGVLLGLVATAAFVAVAVALLPASLVTDRLPPPLAADGVAGTLWSGSADQLRMNGTPLGALAWRLHPLSLFALELDVDVDLTRSDGFVRGRLTSGGGGIVTGRDLELRLPLAAFAAVPAIAGWQGELAGRLPRLRLDDGWPVALEGVLTLASLRTPGSSDSLGDYRITFAAPAPAGAVSGQVTDTGGPLAVDATLALEPARAWRLAGNVTPRPSAPPGITQTLAFLGSATADGRRPFVLTGTD